MAALSATTRTLAGPGLGGGSLGSELNVDLDLNLSFNLDFSFNLNCGGDATAGSAAAAGIAARRVWLPRPVRRRVWRADGGGQG